MNINRNLFLSFALLVGAIFPSFAKVELPSVIGSNMVLQQKSDVALWGTASPCKTVILRPSWTKKKFTVQAGPDGKWLIRIPTPSAGGPYEISFSDIEEMTVDAIFDLASLSKCVGTTLSVMKLMEQGKLSIDDRVDSFIPQFRNYKDCLTGEQTPIPMQRILP